MRTAVLCALLLSGACHAQHAGQQSSDEQSRKFWNDSWTSDVKSGEIGKSYNGTPSEGTDPWAPNAFLLKTLEGRVPGTALDVHMGQGRNALPMVRRGWTVTGFDISDVAVELVRVSAFKQGLKLNAVRASDREFDYGSEQYDLIAAIYAHGWPDTRAGDITRSLKHGGIVVMEAFLRDVPLTGSTVQLPSLLTPVGYRPNELLHTFDSLTVLDYEDAVGKPDGTWAPRPFRFVRLLARKD